MLQLDGLVRRFDGVRAVDGVSFSVERGTVLGFIGPNGAGKTTTMRILATLDTPQRGDARIGGYSVLENPEDVRRITGFMPDYAGYTNTTVIEYLDFFARAYDLRGAAAGGRSRTSSSSWGSAISGTATSRASRRVSSNGSRSAAPSFTIHRSSSSTSRRPISTLARDRVPDADSGIGRRRQDDPSEFRHPDRARRNVRHRHRDREGPDSGDRHGPGDPRGRAPPADPLVRVAGPTDGVERFLLEQPGVLNVHEAGGRVQFEFGGGDDDQVSLVSRLVSAGFRCSSSAPTAPVWRICSSRSRKGGCNEPVPGPSRLAREHERLAQSPRRQGSAPGGAGTRLHYSFGLCLVVGLAVAFFGTADALTGNGTSGRWTFGALIGCLTFLGLVVVPLGTFGALRNERLEQTLELITLTALSPRRVVIGKLLAQGVKLATLFAGLAPFIAMSFLLGGIDFGTFCSGCRSCSCGRCGRARPACFCPLCSRARDVRCGPRPRRHVIFCSSSCSACRESSSS